MKFPHAVAVTAPPDLQDSLEMLDVKTLGATVPQVGQDPVVADAAMQPVPTALAHDDSVVRCLFVQRPCWLEDRPVAPVLNSGHTAQEDSGSQSNLDVPRTITGLHVWLHC